MSKRRSKQLKTPRFFCPVFRKLSIFILRFSPKKRFRRRVALVCSLATFSPCCTRISKPDYRNHFFYCQIGTTNSNWRSNLLPNLSSQFGDLLLVQHRIFIIGGLCEANSSVIASIFRQYVPIQLVPSDCSRCAPLGSSALLSKILMLSKPKKPPSKTLFPSISSRLTHQVKLRSYF